ncbi:MAG: PQQ-binding-like beta-propeller repeat protein [Aquificales bacterium]|nr:PQQ-binding-like beta-propeller repeat protein [Aquificales bacterium]
MDAKKFIALIATLTISLIVVSAIIIFTISLRSQPLHNEHTFNIEESEGTWEMLWERPDIHIVWTLPRTQIIAAMNTICYIAPQETSLFRRQLLNCVDIYSGKQKWTGQANSASDIATDGKQIYVGELRPPDVTAYNAENGQKVWHTTVKARTTSSMMAYSEFASIQGNPNKFYIFDASNGSLQAKDSVPIMAVNSFANDGYMRFHYTEVGHIRAEDIQDDSELWRVVFRDGIAHRPVFSDGLIFVRSGPYRGTIHVIDSKTGHQLWEKEGVVSDFGINDKTLFFVTTHGEILAVDVETGETQRKISS